MLVVSGQTSLEVAMHIHVHKSNYNSEDTLPLP